MKTCEALSIVSFVVLWSGTALAQDAVKVDPSHYNPLSRTRVSAY
jgi:hypothetical protein